MKRLLLISYYFPPSGGPGVQRVLKFVKYLPSFGWQPTVLTVCPEAASYPALDPTLAGEIPDTVQVVRTRSWDPYAVYARVQGKQKGEAVGVGFIKEAGGERWTQRVARWIRANVFLPDARVGWVPFALRAARQLIKTQSFDAIMTSGPPHSTHLVGRAIHRHLEIPWLADFRDPWTDISYYHELPHTALARRLDAGMERSVLSRADAVITVSDSVGLLLKAKADLQRYATISNGFDPDDISAISDTDATTSQQFILAHVGTLAAQQHAPGLVKALAQLAQRNAAFRDKLEVRFVGQVDATILHAFREAGLGEALRLVPYVPHDEAIRHMQAADLLLVAVQRVENSEGIVPAKIFEHLSIGTPVLGIGPAHGDMAFLLQKTGGGAVFGYDDPEPIAAYIAQHLARSREGVSLLTSNLKVLNSYNRRVLTGNLSALLDDITGDGGLRVV